MACHISNSTVPFSLQLQRQAWEKVAAQIVEFVLQSQETLHYSVATCSAGPVPREWTTVLFAESLLDIEFNSFNDQWYYYTYFYTCYYSCHTHYSLDFAVCSI